MLVQDSGHWASFILRHPRRGRGRRNLRTKGVFHLGLGRDLHNGARASGRASEREAPVAQQPGAQQGEGDVTNACSVHDLGWLRVKGKKTGSPRTHGENGEIQFINPQVDKEP